MRLWHYKLIPYLPDKQLLSQWRELNSIFKKQDKHILINYIYEYPKEDLLGYTYLVIEEMQKRKFKIKSVSNCISYFGKMFLNESVKAPCEPFNNHHHNFYLLTCFTNLYEKKIRGQEDFTDECFAKMYKFVRNELGEDLWDYL